MLDRRPGAAPIYAQLAALLEARIARGELLPGDQLPSENELTAQWRVSRATVGKAFDSLAARGVVVRQQGRGTFVRHRPMERRLPELSGFSDHIRGLGMTPGQRLLRFERVTAPGGGAVDSGDPVTSAYPAGTPLVVLHRLRLVEGQPAGLHRSAVPADVADAVGVSERAMTPPDASLYALLEAGGVVLTAAQESLCAVNADPADAALLATTPGAALIEVTRRSTDASGRLVEVVQARYLGSMYVYRIDLARPSVALQESRSGDDGTTQGLGGARRSVGLAARRGVR
jgi:GntR family transcriptional regulator